MIKKYVGFSLIGHSLLLLLCMSWQVVKQPTRPAYPHLQSYIVNETKTQKSSPLPQHATLKKSLAIPKKKIASIAHASQPHFMTPRSQDVIAPPLLQLLHDVIAAKQIYPDSALELNQQGTVKIGFLLYPNGYIENVSILQSSSIPSIDEAALTAVKAISPVHGVSTYLKYSEYVSVDVVFASAIESGSVENN